MKNTHALDYFLLVVAMFFWGVSWPLAKILVPLSNLFSNWVFPIYNCEYSVRSYLFHKVSQKFSDLYMEIRSTVFHFGIVRHIWVWNFVFNGNEIYNVCSRSCIGRHPTGYFIIIWKTHS